MKLYNSMVKKYLTIVIIFAPNIFCAQPSDATRFADEISYRAIDKELVAIASHNDTQITINAIKHLLKKGANPNKRAFDNCTALISAAATNRKKTCEILIDNGAIIDTIGNQGHTALFRAFVNGNLEICELLISHGADINHVSYTQDTLLHIAVRYAYDYDSSEIYAMCEFLINHDIDINKINKKGDTALHIAARSNNIELCSLLMKNKAHKPNLLKY